MVRIIVTGCALAFLAGCSEQVTKPSVVDPTAVTQVSFNPAGAPTVQFTVPDMMCPEGCGAKVKEILSQQPGAKDVLVEFDSKTVTVAIDKDKFDAKQAVAALVDHQFGHSALKESPAASAPATH